MTETETETELSVPPCTHYNVRPITSSPSLTISSKYLDDNMLSKNIVKVKLPFG